MKRLKEIKFEIRLYETRKKIINSCTSYTTNLYCDSDYPTAEDKKKRDIEECNEKILELLTEATGLVN